MKHLKDKNLNQNLWPYFSHLHYKKGYIACWNELICYALNIYVYCNHSRFMTGLVETIIYFIKLYKLN